MTVVVDCLTLLCAVVCLGSGIFCLEIAAAVLMPARPAGTGGHAAQNCRLAVLIPAHNESAGLVPTLKDVTAQLDAGDRLLVVADNCTDDTATVAAEAGAEVVQRRDLSRIGKGYALDHGLRQIAPDPPEIVVIVDADCRLEEGALDLLAQACADTRRPVQALYLMKAPDHSEGINYRIAEFAWRIKNWVRPLGLSALKLPCQLMGTGMAFPWEVIRSVNLATGHIVEDLKLGLDLAALGAPPLFWPSAIVLSQFPSSAKAVHTQRQRWEHGHIGLILKESPRLIGKAILRRNLGLLVLALDLAVPPLFLLAVLLAVTTIASAVAVWFGLSSLPLLLSGLGLGAFLTAVALSWIAYGRDLLNRKSLPLLIPYVADKLRLYTRVLTHGTVAHWVRTDRTKVR